LSLRAFDTVVKTNRDMPVSLQRQESLNVRRDVDQLATLR
jgi:hypothetical protein